MAKKKFYDYQGRLAVIRFEPKRCIHAEECVRGLPEVFQRDRRPWIDPDKGLPEKLVDVVARCPSGSLSIERLDGGPEAAPLETNKARPVPDGPLHLEGNLVLELAEGDQPEQERMALCRCGQSKNRPYCDNSHLEAGFSDGGALGTVKAVSIEDDTRGPVHLRLATNGPILFQGPLEVTSADETMSQVRIKGSLCRCGASRNKPYCDGSHRDAGFEAE